MSLDTSARPRATLRGVPGSRRVDQDELRRQGRADAVVVLFLKWSRTMPGLTIEELASLAEVPPMYLGPAVQRLRERRHPDAARVRHVATTEKRCERCGRPVHQPARPGRPRSLCDECAPYRAKKEAQGA